jgi:hypothetical protein
VEDLFAVHSETNMATRPVNMEETFMELRTEERAMSWNNGFITEYEDIRCRIHLD